MKQSIIVVKNVGSGKYLPESESWLYSVLDLDKSLNYSMLQFAHL